MREWFLATDPAVVGSSGRNVVALADGWQEWAAAARAAYTAAADATRSWPVRAALDDHAARWCPLLERLSAQVDALGSGLGAAAGAVAAADATGSRLLAAPASAAGEQAGTLHRPVNFS